jgi:hypothetical protein
MRWPATVAAVEVVDGVADEAVAAVAAAVEEVAAVGINLSPWSYLLTCRQTGQAATLHRFATAAGRYTDGITVLSVRPSASMSLPVHHQGFIGSAF